MKIMLAQDYFLSDTHAFSLFSSRDQEMADIHGHDFHEIVIVKEGCGFHIINDRVNLVFKGDFFFVSANDIHYYESTRHLSLINILLRCDGEFQFVKSLLPLLMQLQTQTRERPASLNEATLARVVQLAGEIHSKTDDDYDSTYFVTTEAILLTIVGMLMESSVRLPRGGRYDDKKRRLLRSIRDNLQQAVIWEHLAEECAIPKRTLYRFIKEFTGFTPDQFVQRYRLLKAQELLRTTERSVASIARACGFSSLPRLTEAYSRFFQHSPSAEREKRTVA